MKRAMAILLTFAMAATLFIGCGNTDDSKKGFITFSANDVESVDVFTGAVPALAVRKTVTGKEDIQNIVKTLSARTINRAATDADVPTGGIGTNFLFHLTNGDTFFINDNGTIITTSNGSYVANGKSLNTEDFWASLNYEEAEVGEGGEGGLPILNSN